MASEFYSIPIRPTGSTHSSRYPPRLYAHDPFLDGNFSPNYGSSSRSSGYSVGPSENPGGIAHASSTSSWARPSHAVTEHYLRKTMGIAEPLPLNLYSLPDNPDGSKKPSVTDLARLAIWGSRDKRLTLQQIYEAIEERYPSWKASKDKPWRRSIRHNLSLKAIFEHEERPNDHPGKGKYWVLNVSHGEATKRPRVRKDGAQSGSQGSGSEISDDESTPPPSAMGSQAPQGYYAPPYQPGMPSGGPSMQMPMQSMPFNSNHQASMYANEYPVQGQSQYESTNHSGLPNPYGYQQPQSVNPMMTMGNYGMPDMSQNPNLHHMGRGGNGGGGGGIMMETGIPNQAMQVSPYMGLYQESPSLTTRSRRTHSDSFPDEDEDEKTRGMPKIKRSAD